MKEVLSRICRWFLLLGPGLVFALSVLGPGDIVANAAAGTEYGYALIWALALTLLFRYIWVSTSAKYVLVTGKTLVQGYASVGTWVVWTLLLSMIVVKHLQNVYKVALMGSAADLLFPLPFASSQTIWALLFTLSGFAMMFWGGYGAIEHIFKLLIALLGAFLVVGALLSGPDFSGIIRGTLIPSLPQTSGLHSAIFLLMVLIGTESGSMTNLTYSYFIHEKGWRDLSYLRRQRFDLAFGTGCLFALGALLQITAAGTLGRSNLRLEGTGDLMQILVESHGSLGFVVFGLGLFAAVFTSYVGATTGYALIITDICRRILPSVGGFFGDLKQTGDLRLDPVYRWSIAFWSLSPLYILFVDAKPISLVLIVSALTVILIPLLALCLLVITNNKKLLGDFSNGWFANSILVTLVVTSVYLTVVNGIEWLSN
jgi:Mn2+/Fe2+ NRAMP family transporter